ncbi:ORF-54 peptide [Chrysodeixis chalcites nucleopolyhedrovirus]|uniref:ORF-54 peptide n=1 Tax=Chrysodeixis chalcites nucleopolyhedrovirus TaxID=320432 RepID=Q4KT26_9ABAC|nr:ORF-54 peptide [Chrysodeixis chalcites nucleopolyhedrovirus]AAY83985.1 ORF-54 peptide [Chrysodeixis chalcites nucleopolyhedrovirus]AGC36268.1 hypothetical protein TF1A_0054 [Chrysodeixis chalcites SNPV TF1-A]AGE61464.1 hypothetical protein [Chrysodeixis chalcites nucleopolyhedrovirus]AGE61614.1 hypothetical protein [Chrysodeixis chalcites nucleopolyhedrovirus]
MIDQSCIDPRQTSRTISMILKSRGVRVTYGLFMIVQSLIDSAPMLSESSRTIGIFDIIIGFDIESIRTTKKTE